MTLNTTMNDREAPRIGAAKLQISVSTDAEAWNAVVQQLGGTIYHSWEWGELRATAGWRPWRIIASDELGACAAIQVFEHRLPLGTARLLYGARGILCRSTDTAALRALAEWLKRFVISRRAAFLRIDPAIEYDDRKGIESLCEVGFSQLPDEWGTWGALPRSTMIVDLRPSIGELLRNMRRKHREHINRAARLGLEFERSSDPIALKKFYPLLLKSSERQSFPVRSEDYFLRIGERLLAGGRGFVFLASRDGIPVAGILCCRFGEVCYYLYGGFDWNARQAHANEPLQWQAMQWAKDTGCTSYDMVGAGTGFPPKEGNPGFGLYNFKKGLGAELHYSAGYFDLVVGRFRYAAFRLAETHLAGTLYQIYRKCFGWLRPRPTAQTESTASVSD